MNTISLLESTADPQPSSLAARVAALFRSQPNAWIGGMELARIGGIYGWRTRVSDCRKLPFNMTIRNRQRRVTRPDGSSYVVSEYMNVVEKVMVENRNQAFDEHLNANETGQTALSRLWPM